MYKPGHTAWNKGRHSSEETKKKISQTIRGRHHTEEARKKMSLSHLGKDNHQKGRHHTEKAKDRNRQSHLGKHPSEETRKKNSLSNLGKNTWSRGRHLSEEVKEKMSLAARKHWQDPEFVKKVQKGWHLMTKPEKCLETILNQLYPNEFKYNGHFDCGILVDGLVPDFVNVNGQKQVIDMHGNRWHEGEDIRVRMERYAKYGFSSLIVWEKELKENKSEVVKKIVSFVQKKPHFFFDNEDGW